MMKDDSERKIIPHETVGCEGLTWQRFASLVGCLEEELKYAEKQFHNEVENLKEKHSMLYDNQIYLDTLVESVQTYEEQLAKLKAFSALIDERATNVDCLLTQIESVEWNETCFVNSERKKLYEDIVKFNENYLRDMKIMNEVKLELRTLDDQVVKICGIEEVKSGLNTMINLLSFLNKTVEYLESNTKLLTEKHDKML